MYKENISVNAIVNKYKQLSVNKEVQNNYRYKYKYKQSI